MTDTKHIARMVAYWRNSLIEAELSSLDANDKAVLTVTTSALKRGRLTDANTAKIFAIAEQDASASEEAGGSSDTQETLAVTIAPIVAQRRSRGSRGRSRKGIFPLLIPALLNRNGRLHAKEDEDVALPWLPRHLLEPTSSNLVLGDVNTLDRFYTSRPLNLDIDPEASWRTLWQYAWRLLKTTAGNDWKKILQDAGYEAGNLGLVAVSDRALGMAQNIVHIYDQMLASKEWPPLLQTYTSIGPDRPREPSDPSQWQRPARKHLGSLHRQFPLSPSQREALYNFLELPEYSVLGVSGPPGTGKTTLLHSVIAARWIEAALKKGAPPVMVVSSTNNQAVTNVVDSLKNIGEVERWIDVPSFGLYLVNSQKKQWTAKRRGIATTNRWGARFPSEVENAEFIREARMQFLERASEYFDFRFETVASAVQALHGALANVADEMSTAINTAYALVEHQELKQMVEEAGGPEAYRQKLAEPIDAARARLGGLETVYEKWLKHVADEPMAYRVLSPIPAVRYRSRERNRRFLQKNLPGAMVDTKTDTVTAYLKEHLEGQREKVKHAGKPLRQFEKAQQMHERSVKSWQEWRASRNALFLDTEHLPTLENENGDAEKRCLLNWLDTHLRFDLFVLATHYWEGRWLQEVEAIGATQSDFKESQRQQVQEQKWRRYAMLTPCFVTTMHSGPGFFDYYDGQPQPLLDYIDLLIVDEAGQVTPEIGGAMFALSRQALVVGDIKQIEPVWNIPEPVDEGNLKRHGLASDPEALTRLSYQGVMASCGSVMQMAQHVSPYQIPMKNGVSYERGLFLAEHRRCVPEIITYCNELAYSGRLRKKRKSLTDHPWPHMGYAHVKGQSTRRGGSRQNEREARALAAWLTQNKQALEEQYDTNIDDIVGIITPFVAQKRAIASVLKEEEIQISKLGTVHALQGGERPVVLFSTVYSAGDAGPYFFDRGPNMLNVAVSRAKDSFLVFGDMDLLDPAADSPSGLLARHLFASPDNELLDALLPDRVDQSASEDVHHIRTLARHQRTLARVFSRAKRNLVIVSPYLRWRAVQADEICDKVQSAVKRGVNVTVYVDDGFNKNLTHPSAAKAARMLRQSGASVLVCHNIHSKAICIDGEIFIEGSFNWLSAERIVEAYRRYETSTIYMGSQAPEIIKNVLQDIDQHVLTT